MPMQNVNLYLDQLLQTATKGNVTAVYALYVNRMQLSCKVCNSQLTAPEPVAPHELDYGVQEFIKIHAHLGGHKAMKAVVIAPTAVTFDFKPVQKGKLLKIATGRKFR